MEINNEPDDKPVIIFDYNEVPELMTALGMVAMGQAGAHSIQPWADEQYNKLEEMVAKYEL